MEVRYRDVSAYIIVDKVSRNLDTAPDSPGSGGQNQIRRMDQLLSNILGKAPFVISANPDDSDINVERMLPINKPGSGPAGGLATALEHCPTDWCLAIGSSLSKLSTENLRLLLHNRSDEYDVICLSIGNMPQPLAAVYPSWTVQFWKDRLERGAYSLLEGITVLRHKYVVLGSESNTPAAGNSLENIEHIENESE